MNEYEVIKFIGSIAVSFFGAFLGAKFSLSRSKKEKIWDEKRELYNRVIIALEGIEHWAEQVRSEYCCEYTSRQDSNFHESIRDIEKLVASGSLVMNDEFHGLLVAANNLLRDELFNAYEANKYENDQRMLLFQHAVRIRDIVQEYRPKLINSAKGELPKRT